MAVREIVLYPDPVLRTAAAEVTEFGEELQVLLSDMVETMHDAPGIGLAAPQVGISQRIIVIQLAEDEPLLQLINPKIVAHSDQVSSEEGCLSIPGVRETIRRFATVTVAAQLANGEETEVQADGLLSFCLQHEIDHLNGVLFIDYLSKLKKTLIEKKLQRLRKQAT